MLTYSFTHPPFACQVGFANYHAFSISDIISYPESENTYVCKFQVNSRFFSGYYCHANNHDKCGLTAATQALIAQSSGQISAETEATQTLIVLKL